MTKNIVLTGGTSGIGFELLKRLLGEGHRVAVIVRNENQVTELRNKFPSPNLEIFIADLSIQTNIISVAEKIKRNFDEVDILFNNAGVLLGDTIQSNQGNEMHFEVNALAPYLLTLQLQSLLAKSADALIVNTSTDGLHYAPSINVSEVVNPKKNQGKLSLYLNSKLVSLLLMKHIEDTLSKDGIRVINASPSGNKTKLAKNLSTWMMPFVLLFYKSPEHGANLLYKAAFDEQNLNKTQIYLQNNVEQKIKCSINEQQIQELLSTIKVNINE